MKTQSLLRLAVFLTLALALGVPSCWAKAKGYCYIVAYSLREKAMQITPVIVAKVTGDVYNDEEFVADVDVIFSMESQFQTHLEKAGLFHDDTTVEARVAYRSQAIAQQRRTAENSDFSRRGFSVETMDKFKYRP
jgi:hypothetical protein